MIANSLSLFGFDLFGIARRTKTTADKNTVQPSGGATGFTDRRSEERADDREYPEAFFWGLNPFY
jgi:hypothetical protein